MELKEMKESGGSFRYTMLADHMRIEMAGEGIRMEINLSRGDAEKLKNDLIAWLRPGSE